MKTTHSFVAPVLNSTQSKVNTEAYEQAIDNYNEGKHLEAFRLLLDHLNPEFRTKYGNAEGTEFHIPHGSILVNIRIGEGKLHISADFLELPEKGCINVHSSLLPKYRGAAPINWAMLNGEPETGVTIMHMVPALAEPSAQALFHPAQHLPYRRPLRR